MCLWVPPLQIPRWQARTASGTSRRDAGFPNRIIDGSGHWGRFYRELDARMILVDFKNDDRMRIGSREVNQLRNYMNRATGRLGVIVSRKQPAKSAYVTRNSAFTHEDKIILFITVDHLFEMFDIKERGDDPAALVADLIDEFRLQWE